LNQAIVPGIYRWFIRSRAAPAAAVLRRGNLISGRAAVGGRRAAGRALDHRGVVVLTGNLTKLFERAIKKLCSSH
jgi:hypothetical protein